VPAATVRGRIIYPFPLNRADGGEKLLSVDTYETVEGGVRVWLIKNGEIGRKRGNLSGRGEKGTDGHHIGVRVGGGGKETLSLLFCRKKRGRKERRDGGKRVLDEKPE